MAATIMRVRDDVTLHIHCLPCYILSSLLIETSRGCCRCLQQFLLLSLFHLLNGDLGQSIVIILFSFRETGQVSNIFLGEEFHMFGSRST
jgi:hypothetical protein